MIGLALLISWAIGIWWGFAIAYGMSPILSLAGGFIYGMVCMKVGLYIADRTVARILNRMDDFLEREDK
jgi:hypothetical protein